MNRCATWIIAAMAGAALAVRAVGAQTLADRIAAVRDGRVQIRFAARPGVCGDGRGLICAGSHLMMGNYSDHAGTWRAARAPGPVRIVLTVHGGVVSAMRTFVGGNDSAPDVTDLGTLSAKAATDYLLSLAQRAPEGRLGEEAIVGSVLADSVTVWPALLTLARDSALPRATRQSATFWLGRLAAAARNGTTLFAENEENSRDADDESVRSQAIFALSQQPRDEGIPMLIRVARTNSDPHLRSQALFWLGQSGDPRAIDLFEEILRGGQ